MVMGGALTLDCRVGHSKQEIYDILQFLLLIAQFCMISQIWNLLLILNKLKGE
jgi:hypothetical protein